MEQLIFRVELLVKSGQISDNAGQKTLDFIKYLSEDRNYELTEENSSMLITHVAMAINRLQLGELVEALDQNISIQLHSSPKITEACEIVDKLVSIIGPSFDEQEYDYILMHVLNLVGE